MSETVLITGGAGFIGSNLGEQLVARGDRVIALDNFNDFYHPDNKRRNIENLQSTDAFELREADIRDRAAVMAVFEELKPTRVVHLAAMAGVRPSIENPKLYIEVNMDGTTNVLDAALSVGVKKFLFASSSSVYGNNEKVPFSEEDPVDFPISPYAATKRSGELLCHTYTHLFDLPIFCLRFFTVFGPRQRPDLAISKFLRMVDAGESIPFFGDGSTSRDYTFVEDIVNGVIKCLDACDRFRIYNIGGNDPVSLKEMVETVERVVGKKAVINQMPMQPGDVNRTYADLTRIESELGYAPSTSLESGMAKQWAYMQQHPAII